MNIHTNIPLKNYTTMKLGGPARFMSEAVSPDDIATICHNAKAQSLPLFTLGGGSNLIVKDEGFSGVVIHNKIMGFEVLSNDEGSVTIKIGAGEIWDEVVAQIVSMNLSGIEALSGIPGTVGAAPVQNIGAYGQEVSDTLLSLEAYDTTSESFVTLENERCHFSYRSSIFRSTEAGRYIITSVTLRLITAPPTGPFYAALQHYFETNTVTLFTPQVIRDAVIAIRTEKLPDPRNRPNAGSFFKNAIVEKWQLDELKLTYPDIPSYDLADGKFKVPTGWLIEQVGLKGELLHGMRVHDKNALVLINESASSYADLATARDKIISAVRDTFRIAIEQEPLELS